MLHLIPSPVHRLALRIAHRLRHHWRRMRKVTGEGVSVVGHDLEGQVLLVRHSYGPDGWYLPGGGIKRRETPEQAARRELEEEAGCEIQSLKLLGEIEEELSGASHRAYLFSGVVDDTPQADGREVLEARFFPTHSLPEPLSPRTRVRLDMWLHRRS